MHKNLQDEVAGVARERDEEKTKAVSKKKVNVFVQQFGIRPTDTTNNAHTTLITPTELEFSTSEHLEQGSLIKILVSLPDYWKRKQKHVEYGTIEKPEQFRILAKVMESTDSGKKNKRITVRAQTLVIDEIDQRILDDFIAEES